MITSIKFPDILNRNSVNLVYDSEATLQNTKLLLLTNAGEFVSDPEFGANLKRYMFEQNDLILRDIIIDDIYSAIATFIPQAKVDRKNITLSSDGVTLTAFIRAENMLDHTTDLYSINLLETIA